MCANWQMDMTEIEMLFDKLKLIPDQSEKIINTVLKQKGAPMAMENIQENIPLSPRKNKMHAKTSSSLTVKHENMGFTIRPKRAFEYIKYPDLAIGTSHRNREKMFMKKGLDRATPKIVDDLTTSVLQSIEDTLN